MRAPALVWWLAGRAVGARRRAGAARRARRLAAAAARRCAGRWACWRCGLAWLALAQARGIGINFLLSVFCLVWVADIAAYFGGRAFGRRKLAPTISPGKSWEGVWSGMAGVLLLALLWLLARRASSASTAPSLFSRLLRAGWAGCGGAGRAACWPA